jgi:hypothetical protein
MAKRKTNRASTSSIRRPKTAKPLKPAAGSTRTSSAKPAAKPSGRSSGKPAGRPVGKPVGKTAGKSTGRLAAQSSGKPAAKSAGQSARGLSGRGQRAVKKTARTATAPVSRSAKAGAKAVKKADKKAAEVTVKKTVKKAAKMPVGRAATGVKKATSARPRAAAVQTTPSKRPYLDRERRVLDETVQTPPSSLDMDRHGSAARSGRAALRASLKEHTGMTPELTAGDVDADWENAYFSGEEAPGGDNPSPEENVVEDIGKALGVEYQDGEELQGSNKVIERDEHRWELDPASAEDYKERE